VAIPAVPSPSARSWPRGDLDVILTHKLRAPGQPELAIGSVSEEVAGKSCSSSASGRRRAALGVGGPHFEPDAEWLREILNREGRRLGAGAQLSPRLVPQRDRGQGKGSTFSVELKLSENLLTNESPLAIKKRYLLEHPRSRMAMTITSPFFSQRIG
jgi:hypothetical protein